MKYPHAHIRSLPPRGRRPALGRPGEGPDMSSDLLLNVKDLHAGYGRAEVLHGLNLSAKKGSVITVIGPNGAGKSTMLNALMGVLPSRGSIDYQGQSVTLNSLEERVMLGMALVPETRALFGTMPVEDNLLLAELFPR